MTIGRFALPMRDGRFYDSIHHVVRDCESLESHNLLSGQEQSAIIHRLLAPGPFSLLLIPSFECNLRCPQCYVGHLLKKPSGNQVGDTDPNLVVDFVRRAQETLGPLKSMSIVGGEPLLHPAAFRKYIKAGLPVSATTNGIFNFDEVQDVLAGLKHLTFSIDGWPEQHNRTRKSLNPEINPFVVTYRNLCKTIETFPQLEVIVQGTIIDEGTIDPYNSYRYNMLMLAAGVKRRNISLGPCTATKRRAATHEYMDYVTKATRKTPCCDYTMHKGFYIYNNELYGSYYRFEEFPPFAHLRDSVDDILASKKAFIMSTMPILQDSVCMTKCSAVGVCWGMCTSDRHVYTSMKPSSVCDRTAKELSLKNTVDDML